MPSLQTNGHFVFGIILVNVSCRRQPGSPKTEAKRMCTQLVFPHSPHFYGNQVVVVESTHMSKGNAQNYVLFQNPPLESAHTGKECAT